MNVIALVKNKMKSALIAVLYFAPVHVFMRVLAKNSTRIIFVMIAMFFIAAVFSGEATELDAMLAGFPWLMAAFPFIILNFVSDEYTLRIRGNEAQQVEA